jgi:hypothetical protein
LQFAIESRQPLDERVRVPEGVEQRSQCQQGFELVLLFAVELLVEWKFEWSYFELLLIVVRHHVRLHFVRQQQTSPEVQHRHAVVQLEIEFVMLLEE